MYEIKNEDQSKKLKLIDAFRLLEVGQSFNFEEHRLLYMRHRSSYLGKRLNRVFSVNKDNCSVTRTK